MVYVNEAVETGAFFKERFPFPNEKSFSNKRG
jgi:hypothetical protein